MSVLGECSVVEATEEQTTAALAVACRPELIILDATDPSAAIRAVEALRGDFRTAQAPILFIVDAVPVDGALVSGLAGDDYVVCPFDSEELAARVHLALGRVHDRRRVNPLSGLPANVAVSDQIADRLVRGVRFACLYIDLDGFKAFNDLHGFARGDDVIVAVARYLVRVLERMSARGCFVGHLGGDDFVLLVPSEIAEDVADGIVAGFAADASGCDISVGVVTRADAYADAAQLGEAAATAKRMAKDRPGSAWASHQA
jgi:diguanylate cyclase (GGDEF)-like protein